MIDVDLGDGAFTVEGALDLDVTPTGVIPRRLPVWTKTQMDDPFMDLTVQMPSGVRLRFASDATTIELDVMLSMVRTAPRPVIPADFDLVVDGELIQCQSTSTGAVMDLGAHSLEGIPITPGDVAMIVSTALEPRAKVVEIWLPKPPSWSCGRFFLMTAHDRTGRSNDGTSMAALRQLDQSLHGGRRPDGNLARGRRARDALRSDQREFRGAQSAGSVRGDVDSRSRRRPHQVEGRYQRGAP